MSASVNILKFCILGSILRYLCQNYCPEDFLTSIAHAATEDWNRVKEEIFLFRNPNVTEASMALKEPPLFLFSLKALTSLLCDRLMFWILEILGIFSFIIYDITMRKYSVNSLKTVWLPAATFVYCFNPYTIFAFASQSVGIFSTLTVAWTFIGIASDHTTLASIMCAIGCYINIYSGYLLLAIVVQVRQTPIRVVKSVLAFVLCLGGLLLASAHLDGDDWGFLRYTYLSNIFALDTTPNMGLFWYMYVEMFDHFNTFFVWTMQLLIFGTCVAATLRFYEDPLFLAVILTMSTGILRPYNSIADLGCSLALAAHWRHLTPYFRNLLFTLGLMGTALILSPLFYFTWLRTATSNANFYFAAALIHSLGRVSAYSFPVCKNHFTCLSSPCPPSTSPHSPIRYSLVF
uniref:Phosphatidylinositol glycan anchor biosynthesis class U protein n=1 Tax=Schistocephalus solidus TaxID=70667 RepID=A0A0V0J1A2_SCHSO